MTARRVVEELQIRWRQLPPVGVIDGSNDQFEIEEEPISGTLQVYLNGLLQYNGEDYSILGTTITFFAESIPRTDDILMVIYAYQL